MFDNPLVPIHEPKPNVETELLSGELAEEPTVDTVDGQMEARFDLIVRHPSHAFSGRIPIVCRGETILRASNLRPGTRVTVAGVLAFDDERKPSEFILCEYLKVAGGDGGPADDPTD